VRGNFNACVGIGCQDIRHHVANALSERVGGSFGGPNLFQQAHPTQVHVAFKSREAICEQCIEVEPETVGGQVREPSAIQRDGMFAQVRVEPFGQLDRLTPALPVVAEVERLHWRIWNGKAKNAERSIKRIRKVMHVFKGEHSQGARGVPSRQLWHALHAIDKYLRGQAAWLVNYAKRYRAGERVGTSITEGTVNFLVYRRMNKSQQMR
jgi:hypothetical protein